MQKSYHSSAQRPYRPAHKRNNSRRPQTKEIHSSRFINKAVVGEVEAPYVSQNAFADFALNDRTQATLKAMGFETPSAIQDQAIVPALEGKDVIGLANTGTGKTAAFLLPIIERLSDDNAHLSALILAPTRELAQQIDTEFRRFAESQRLFSVILVGGTNIGRQISQVQRKPHVIIGTPGRIKDLMNRGILRLDNVKTFVLDEADRMCDMGFSKDIRFIAGQLPAQHQTLCFSATMTQDVKIIVEEFMTDPVTISVVRKATSEHIEQDVVHANDKMHKLELLTDLLKQDEFKKVVVFGETKFGVQRLSDALNKEGLSTVAIHGNKSQSQRERALKSFRSGAATVLIATDVAARGLDVPDVSHVINFDQPQSYDDYIHRIGRTGRAGKTGKALTFVTSR